MSDIPNTLADRNLDATTVISLRREPACFAFLSSHSTSAPIGIDAINLDLASVDFYAGRASIWATLEIRSEANDDQAIAVLGFDESFLRPFTRALIEAATTRSPYRMLVRAPEEDRARCRVVEYVTGPGTALTEILITPQDQVLLIGISGDDNGEETLFQLPRSDAFLRAFTRMTHRADQVLRQTIAETERLGRRRTA